MTAPATRARRAAALAVAVAALLAGCATPGGPGGAPTPAPSPARPAGVASEAVAADGAIVARSARWLLHRAAAGDSYASIAARHLGDASLAWRVADANPGIEPAAGVVVTVPLSPPHPLGVSADAVQTVPILCYHRLGSGTSKMVIAPAQFETQMNWLVANGYRVVPLSDLEDFLAGRRALPRRAVVLTFDDGYESVYRHAWPVLRRLKLPATVFVYTDFLGGGDALTWAQLQEMHGSGLVDVQSHSKSHRNLTERRPSETDERYRGAIDAELRVPREVLERRLPALKVRHLAYPFGDANEVVLDTAARQGVALAATVSAGGNAFYASPLLLRRTMIFGDMSLDAFKARLQVSRPLSQP